MSLVLAEVSLILEEGDRLGDFARGTTPDIPRFYFVDPLDLPLQAVHKPFPWCQLQPVLSLHHRHCALLTLRVARFVCDLLAAQCGKLPSRFRARQAGHPLDETFVPKLVELNFD